jgi:hypothetical protein
VTVVIIGLSKGDQRARMLFENGDSEAAKRRTVENINAYLKGMF